MNMTVYSVQPEERPIFQRMARESRWNIKLLEEAPSVENADQYLLIKDISKNTNVQGYYFYRPLDKVKFIEELRKNK